ncbi:MAG: DDE-type integrase/transposase/recombinase [Desulfovermiculus sp.]|nr:DDE-type integrase/transposase/recombinase [Desulfovermiculus sp.]
MANKQFEQHQKLAILKHAREIGIKEAAKVAGVHYTTVYEWRKLLQELGEEAFLEYQPKRPGRGHKEITPEQESAILQVWQDNPAFGPGQVRSQLRRQGTTISMRTIRQVMQANGYSGNHKQDTTSAPQRFEATRPLELAQMDILEVTINKARVYLILLIDDFSRFILGYRLLEQTSIDAVIELVRGAVDRYGKMEELLTDRGFVFYSWRGINRFERYLENEGIDHTHARPHHPQTLGKVEALNKRIKHELFRQEHFATLEQAFSALQTWVDHYNHKRPHQGLGGLLVPGERFHGQEQKALDDIANLRDLTAQVQDIERSIVNLVLAPDGRVTLYLLGQPVVIKGGLHV